MKQLKSIIGKKIVAIRLLDKVDEGFEMTFKNGQKMKVSWAGYEGRCELDDVEIDCSCIVNPKEGVNREII